MLHSIYNIRNSVCYKYVFISITNAAYQFGQNAFTYRTVARSENRGGGHVVIWWALCAPLVEIGLTDLPKTAPPLATAMSLSNANSFKIKTL